MDLNLTTKEVTECSASVGNTLAVREIQPSGTLAYRFLKRLFDLVFSLCVSVVLFIPVAVVCVLIRLESSGSPVYAQERVGKGGKAIKILKLRSMVADAGNVQKYLSPEQLYQWEVERKVDDDPRITKVGQFIRKCSIDEMPQFLNVLNGDLSVIGPRPITRDELEQHFPMRKRPSYFLSSLASRACGRRPIATLRRSRAACVKRSSFITCVTDASAWIGNVLPAPLVPCLAGRGRGDKWLLRMDLWLALLFQLIKGQIG